MNLIISQTNTFSREIFKIKSKKLNNICLYIYNSYFVHFCINLRYKFTIALFN